jgi:ATP-dependent Clp protease ATP-binding subunit ClpA
MSVVSFATDINLSKEAQKTVHIAGRKAEEYLHASFGAPHLLWALLNKEISTFQLLRDQGKDIFYLQEWASVRLEEYPKANRTVRDVEAAPDINEILTEADQLRHELEIEEINTACLLAVLCIPGLAFSYDQLKTFSLTKGEVLASAFEQKVPGSNGQAKREEIATHSSDSSGSVLEQYCRNKHTEVAEQEHFQLIKREEEVKTCLEILSRYAKANVIFIGESGVGKTALISGLAQQVGGDDIPVNLGNAQIYELDIATMQAGASYKGELEDRFQKILDAIKKLENPMLVIEDIHTLLDQNKSMSSLANLLTMELNKGEVTIIGTTTPENFRKHIEQDELFSRRFETLTLEEPSDEDSIQIIKTVIQPHESHHNLSIDELTIEEAIRLAKRYDKERRLPDAAIDLIDRSMARVRISANKMDRLFQDLKQHLQTYKDENDDTTSLQKSYHELKQKAGPLLRHHFDYMLEPEESFENEEALISYLEETIPEVEEMIEKGIERVEQADLAAIISRKTGIPTGKIQTQERKRLLNMEDVLRERVVGQDQALESVAEAVLESRSGLLKGDQPIGSFFFLGPTGTGKTELAKALSEFLFQDEQAMIRFDMSEFKEEHSAAMLYGSPPGYVGYEEGGMLVNKIRERPYSVVLFDEIEKAHSSVFDIFLQILDEGKLNDRLGKEGDFSNAVILFTSNIASKDISRTFNEEGTLPSSQKLKEKLSGHFRPEFLGRLTEIVPFAPISEEVLVRIFEIHLAELLETAAHKGVTVILGDDTIKHLSELGYSPQYGARPLKGVIRDKIRRPLSRMLIDGTVNEGDQVQLALDTDKQLEWNIN